MFAYLVAIWVLCAPDGGLRWPVRMRMPMRMYVRAPGGYQGAMLGLGLLYSIFLIMFVLWLWLWLWLCYATRSGLKYTYKFCLRINIMLTKLLFA